MNHHQNHEPEWRVDEEICDEAFQHNQDNPEGFMVVMVTYHIRRSQQLLNYRLQRRLENANLREMERIFCHYYGTAENNGLARVAVKRALSKCRSIRRQKIYGIHANIIGITPDYEKFFYAPRENNPNRLVPYMEETFETRLGTSYYLEIKIGEEIGIPQIYSDLEFIILFVKGEEGIFINFIRPRTGFIESVFKRHRRE